MKFKLNLSKKEVELNADVEKIIDKSLERQIKNPDKKSNLQIRLEEKRKIKELGVQKKTKYQIQEEEKRKTMELEHQLKLEAQKQEEELKRKRFLQYALAFVALLLFGLIASFLGI